MSDIYNNLVAQIATLTAERDVMAEIKTEAKRALDHYDMRSEMHTSWESVAIAMASILKPAFHEQEGKEP